MYDLSVGRGTHYGSGSGILFTDGDWHHTTLTASPATGLSFYQDCTLKHTDPASVVLRNAVEPLMSDNQTAGPDSTALEGTLDDVRFYDRELSAADIAKFCR